MPKPSRLDARVKEAKLIKSLVAGKTMTQSGLDAGYGHGRNPETARTQAWSALQRPTVRVAYDKALAKAGLTIDGTAKVIVEATKANKLVTVGDAEVREVEDHPVRLRAVELAGRFRGHVESEAASAAAGAVMALGYFIARNREARGLPSL